PHRGREVQSCHLISRARQRQQHMPWAMRNLQYPRPADKGQRRLLPAPPFPKGNQPAYHVVRQGQLIIKKVEAKTHQAPPQPLYHRPPCPCSLVRHTLMTNMMPLTTNMALL